MRDKVVFFLLLLSFSDLIFPVGSPLADSRTDSWVIEGIHAAKTIEVGTTLEGTFDQATSATWYKIYWKPGPTTGTILRVGLMDAPLGVVELYDPEGHLLPNEKPLFTGDQPLKTYWQGRLREGTYYIFVKGERGRRYWLSTLQDLEAPFTEPRRAAQAGLNLLNYGAHAWSNHHRCIGCHVQPHALMALSIGQFMGYQIDRTGIENLAAFLRARQRPQGNFEDDPTSVLVYESPVTLSSYSSLALSYYSHPSGDEGFQFLWKAGHYLISHQQQDGRWVSDDKDRPAGQNDLMVTVEALLVLQRLVNEIQRDPAGLIPETFNLLSPLYGGKVERSPSKEPDTEGAVANLVDGDLSTGWSSGSHSELPQEVVFSFFGGLPATLNQITLSPPVNTYKWRWVKEIEVLATVDGEDWESLGKFTLGPQEGPQTFSFPLTVAKKLRLRILSGYGEVVQLGECEVGEAASSKKVIRAALIESLPGRAIKFQKALQKGLIWLEEAGVRTLQDRTFKLIGLALMEDPTYDEILGKEREALWALQNEDGGWSEEEELRPNSNAYATGQALYALKLSGIPEGDPRFLKGVRFLLGTQQWDGLWKANNTRSPKPSDLLHTLWASFGLAVSSEAMTVEILNPTRETEVSGPWTLKARVQPHTEHPVERVEFFVDDELGGIDREAPYELSWDFGEEIRRHKIKIVAYNSAGARVQDVMFTREKLKPGFLEVVFEDEQALKLIGGGTTVELILDASRSMRKEVEGKPKIEIAKQVLRTIVQNLPEDMEIGLRVSGQNTPSRPLRHHRESCQDTQLVVPFGKGNKEELLAAISTVTAQGAMPFALSLHQLKADFLGIRGEKVVVLLTDGKEECRGDPVKAVRELLEEGFKIRMEVIGLAIEAAATKKRLQEIAEITGGHYYDVRKASELELVLRKAVNVAYKVYNGNGFEVAQGFVGDGSKEILPGKYKVVIFSEPLFSVKDVTIKPEGFTRIKIQSEDGQVKASIR